MDQAQRLRDIVSGSKSTIIKKTAGNKPDARVITISSGKGGVGKTNFTVNLAIALSKLGNRVTVVDADLGMANIDVLLGLVPRYTLSNVVNREKSMEEVIFKGPNDINIISGGSGIIDLVNLKDAEINQLIEGFTKLNEISDYILIDTGAGMSNSVLSFINAATDVILIITPDPTSITDAYALIKNISDVGKEIKLVINRIDSNKEGQEVFNKLEKVAKKFLNIELRSLGYIYEDNHVKKAVRMQKPFLMNYPNCLASKGLDLIAYNIENNNLHVDQASGFSKFINRLFVNL